MSDSTMSAHDGIELAVRDHAGDGPDVLLLHGVTRTLLDWEPVVADLKNLRAVAVDLRWHGLSGVPETFRWDDFVDDVDDVIEGLGLDNPVVVGHSYGGSIAGSWAVTHPDARGAINIDGFEPNRVELYDGIDRERADEFVRRWKQMQGNFMPQADEGDAGWRDGQLAAQEQMEQGFGVTGDLAREAAARALVPTGGGRFVIRPPRRFYELTWAEGATPNVIETIGRIECPFLFVKCLSSGFAPPYTREFFDAVNRGTVKALEALADAKPNVRVATIEASHGVIYSHPAEIARLIGSLAYA